MIILYHGGGAALSEVMGPSLSQEEWDKLRRAVARLTTARGHPKASELLEAYPFQLLDGTNYFGDEFSVLYAKVPLEQYAELNEIDADPDTRDSFRILAQTISEIGPFTRFVACALDTDERVIPVSPPSPRVTSEAVDRALADAEHLIRSRGPSSAVDRVHTALHGYLRAILERGKVELPKDPSITKLFALLRGNESALRDLGEQSGECLRVIRAMATIIDSLNTLRNRSSGAHASDSMLAEAEAMLAINAARTLLHYLDEKLVDT